MILGHNMHWEKNSCIKTHWVTGIICTTLIWQIKNKTLLYSAFFTENYSNIEKNHNICLSSIQQTTYSEQSIIYYNIHSILNLFPKPRNLFIVKSCYSPFILL